MLWFSFNFIIYLQVTKTCEEYNCINEFKFLFFDAKFMKNVATRSLNLT